MRQRESTLFKMEDLKPVIGLKRPLVEHYDSDDDDLQKPKVKREWIILRY